MRQDPKRARSTRKVRRDFTGGKRGDGHRRRHRVRRPDPATIRIGRPDGNTTAVGGLVSYGVFLRENGIDDALTRIGRRLKSSPSVVYPMGGQLRLLTDAFAVGETRVFGVEGLASDPLFVRLAGGRVPSIDTLYDDLDRFDETALGELEELGAQQGLRSVRALRGPFVYLDVDTTVLPIAGRHEGALPGPNPRYHGRPSFHPMLARIAATDTIVGAQLRPGNTGFGTDDVPRLRAWVQRAGHHLRRGAALCVRVDAAGDCAEVLKALHELEAFYVIKAHVTQDLLTAVWNVPSWRTVDRDADGRATRQVAEIDFVRNSWRERALPPVRVIAVRSRDRPGKQVPLLDNFDLDWSLQVFLTNRVDDPDDIAWAYDRRAGIEPLIAELKGAWGLGHASSFGFAANHAVVLLKVLAHNLLARYARERFASLPDCRTAWRRRTLLRVPARLSRSGRRSFLHLPPGSALLRRLE
jgi:hypothetical protein